MTITPKPITARTLTLEERSPIGTRYTDGEATYTLVAYDIDPARGKDSAHPVLLGDYELDTSRTEYEFIADGSVTLEYAREIVARGEVLEVAPDNPEKAARARAAAVKRYNEPARDTSDEWRVLAFEDLDTDEKVQAFHQWVEAELEMRKAEAVLARVAKERAYTLQRLVSLTGSQQNAASLVGRNQSSVSRAMRSLGPDRP